MQSNNICFFKLLGELSKDKLEEANKGEKLEEKRNLTQMNTSVTFVEGENAKCKVGVEQQNLISDANKEQIPTTINGKSEPQYES